MRLLASLTVVIILLLVLSTSTLAGYLTSCSDNNPMCKDGKLTYQLHTKYDTPFNPHRILDTWEVLAQEILPGVPMPFIIMGNPKIDWGKFPQGLDPTLAILPDGEIYSAVVFTFCLLPDEEGNMENGTVELLLISYRDPTYGTTIIHSLNEAKNGYEKMLDTLKESFDDRKKDPKHVGYYIIK